MIITNQGGHFFKVQFGDTTIALNPVSKESKLKNVRFGADIALVSLNHKDMNGVDSVAHGDKEPFVIAGPGEYEIKGVFIKGLLSESEYDGQKRINTIYTIVLEGMNLCFMGAVSLKDLPPEVKEAIGEPDVLFVPIGGNGTLGPLDAYNLAVKLEAKLVIPMGYAEAEKGTLQKFLKEGGTEECKPVDKLTLKKKDLEGKDGEIVILAEA
jgi:hypothetical protein